MNSFISPERSPNERCSIGKLSVPSEVHLSLRSPVEEVVFCPFDLSASLFAVCGGEEITVYSLAVVRDQSKGDAADGMDDDEPSEKTGRGTKSGNLTAQKIVSLRRCISPRHIAWRPQTSLHSVPRRLDLVVASKNHTVYRLEASPDTVHEVAELVGLHKSFINAIAVEHNSGEFAATVGDDRRCIIWSLEEQQEKVSLPLTSPGMAVAFHPVENHRMLVAEKNGVIRFFSTHSYQSLQYIETNHQPLLSADWKLSSPALVGVVAGDLGITFNPSASSNCIHQSLEKGATLFKFSPASDKLWATLSPGSPSVVRVHQLRLANPLLSESLPGPVESLSWHASKPLLAIGCGRTLLILHVGPA